MKTARSFVFFLFGIFLSDSSYRVEGTPFNFIPDNNLPPTSNDAEQCHGLKSDIKKLNDLLHDVKNEISDLKREFNDEQLMDMSTEKNHVCSEPKKLGMQNGLISDSQISASTEWDSNHGPSNSRLFYTPHNGRTGAWSAKKNDINQWLQIDFKQPTAIVGISTQGRAGRYTQFVKSYIMSYSQDGLSFQAFKSHGILKVFDGNFDIDTVVHHDLPTTIIARYIRVHPRTWHGHISMRMELHGCYIDCKNPSKLIGSEDRRMHDHQMSASSELDYDHRAQNGRLNSTAHNITTGAWSAKVNDVNQWLQVDFEQQTVITGISTQGRTDCCNQFVKTYIVLYSNDGVEFQPYKELNQIKIFSGNKDKFGLMHHDFSSPIMARYIRVEPKTWNEHISLRMELFGCFKDCDDTKSLGMHNRKIQDSQITASSEWDWFHGPKNARLFFTARNGRTGAWSSKSNDLNQWLQVDFKHQIVVSGISTQGREGCCSQWVKTYMLQYSMDGISFFPYMYNGQVKVFNGNTDRHSVVHNAISPAIVARYIRIRAKSWNGHISLRAEFYGC